MKLDKPVWLLMVLIIMGGLVYGGIGVSKSLFSLVGDSDAPITSKYIESPTFSYLSCRPTTPKAVTRYFGAERVAVTCASDNFGSLLGMTDGCTVTLIAPDKSTFTRRQYAYVVTRGGITIKQADVPGGVLGYHGESVSLNIKRGDTIHLAYGIGFNGKLADEGQKYIVSGTPYAIHIHDSLSSLNGQVLPGSRVGSCILEDNYFKNREITYFDPSIKELANTPSKALDFRSLNEPNGVFTYFSHFTPLPAFSEMIEEKDGKQVYCKDNRLYPTYPITVNGYTYQIVNYQGASAISTVTCCNGNSRPGYTCQNHQWVENSKTVCDLSKGILCKPSVYQPLGSKTYYRYSCVNNHCVKDNITTECTYDSDCEENEVCLRSNDPLKNKCISGGLGADTSSKQPPEKGDTDWVPFAILGGAVGLGILVSKQKINNGAV